MKLALIFRLLLASPLPFVVLMFNGCRTARHVAHETGDAAGYAVKKTGRVVQKGGTKVKHVGERIGDRLD